MNSLEQLIETVTSLMDFEEVSQALFELSDQNPSVAIDLSFNILNDRKGDVFLQAFSLDILYDLDRPKALSFIRINCEKVEVYLLGEMLSLVTMDSSFIKEDKELCEVVGVLKRAISLREGEDMDKISENFEWFRDSFKE